MPDDSTLEVGIEAYLERHRRKSLLRFIVCGSVDDGKSTLIGRLLYDAKLLCDDQLASVHAKSSTNNSGGFDFAGLVDGLAAEREQGITIDVAYRFFATDVRKFIVADTPGHEQYTRNMATGASTADLAVILVDARKGVLTQTRRHSAIVALMGIRQIVLAVNKLDLMGWSRSTFERIVEDYRGYAAQIGVTDVRAIPTSALKGDNIASRSADTPWYDGPTLLEHLEDVAIDEDKRTHEPFRMPVQWVNRPNLDFRGVSGLIVGGAVRAGDKLCIAPSGKIATAERIVTQGGVLACAVAGQSVTICFAEDVDCSRGDVLSAAAAPVEATDQFEATLIWMAEERALPGRAYWLKLGAKTASAQITAIKHELNVNTLERTAAKALELNEIGVCNISLDQMVAFDAYADNPATGSFIIIDKMTNATVAAGLINFALRRAQNLHWQSLDITRAARAELKHQTAAVLWFTGFSGAGKSTIANLVEKRLHSLGKHTVLLDGDNVRHGLNRNLGFTDADRVENIRRVAEVARLMTDAGLIVLVSFISPFRAEREMARAKMAEGEFFEVFIDTPIAEAERRDVKGLYKKARAGELKNFTGIDSPYEPPTNPELHIDTTRTTPEAAADLIVQRLLETR
jgi:bifunctional enzyme CysN/CysC